MDDIKPLTFKKINKSSRSNHRFIIVVILFSFYGNSSLIGTCSGKRSTYIPEHRCILANGKARRNAPIPFSPTKGSDHVNTSMKLGSQYGCGEQLNCRMFMTLFSYFKTAAWWGYSSDVGQCGEKET